MWNRKPFNIYDNEAKTVLELIKDLGKFANNLFADLTNKTDLHGDHKGSWQGLEKPTLSDEGMRATVEKIQNVDLPTLKDTVQENIINTNEKTSFSYVDEKINFLSQKIRGINDYISSVAQKTYVMNSATVENKKFQGGLNIGDPSYKIDSPTRISPKKEYQSNGKISISFNSTLYDMYYLEYTNAGKFIKESDWFTTSPAFCTVPKGNKVGVLLAKKDKTHEISPSDFDDGNFVINILSENDDFQYNTEKVNFIDRKTINNMCGVFRFGTWNLTYANTKWREIPPIIMTKNLNFLGIQEFRSPNSDTTISRYTDLIHMPFYHVCKSIENLSILATSNLYKISQEDISLELYEGTELRVVSKQKFIVNGKYLSVYTVHLDYLQDTNKLQLNDCLNMLNDDDSHYKIMLGDFNVYSKDDYNIFKENYYLANGKDGIWFDTYKEEYEGTRAIDNIIVSKNIDIIKVSTIDVNRDLADHNPLFADIIFK